MSKTLIIGNSIASAPVIERIRRDDPEVPLVFLATESVLPYDRSLLPSLVAGRVKESQLFTLPADFFQLHQVEVIANEPLSRISVKRKYVTAQSKKQFSYGRLILLDTGEVVLPALKGIHKEGVFDALRLTSVKALIKYLPFTDHIALVIRSLQGLNMACALSSVKKEVVIVASAPGLLPEIFDEETGLLLKQILEARGVRVVPDQHIEEILGDAQVKAVKLTSGKVMACDMVVFDEARPDLRVLSEETLSPGDELAVEDCFKAPVLPVAPASFGLSVVDGFCAGMTLLPQGGREYLKFDGPANVYKKIYVLGEHLVGAVLFNAPSDQKRLWQMMQEKVHITGKEEDLLNS